MINNLFNMSEKNSLVTGAAGKIGTMISHTLAELGSNLILVDIFIEDLSKLKDQIQNKFNVDDSLDVFPVHGVGGILGTLLTGVFAASTYGGVGLENTISQQVTIQFIGIVFTIIWCGIFTFIALKITDNLVGLRVSDENEETGIDLTEHGEKGYNN